MESHPMFDMPEKGENKKEEAKETLGKHVPSVEAFHALATKYGVSTKGLHKNEELAKVQLVGRIKDKFGHEALEHPDAKRFMASFKPDKEHPHDKNQAKAVADRTLGALLGK